VKEKSERQKNKRGKRGEDGWMDRQIHRNENTN
jgi:hypothetical protein